MCRSALMSYYKDRRESAVLTYKNIALSLAWARERVWREDITRRRRASPGLTSAREREEITLQIRSLARRKILADDRRTDKSIDYVRKVLLRVGCRETTN